MSGPMDTKLDTLDEKSSGNHSELSSGVSGLVVVEVMSSKLREKSGVA